MGVALQPNLLVAGRFRLVRLLGQGGMGSVWLAQHEELDIPCAVKFIEGDKSASPEFRQRFQREAKAAAKLRSPNVVQILDSGVWEDVPYIAMELLEGEELAARVERGPMPPATVVEILSQVARALAKAHAAGIVHRDLKPENIFLTRDVDRLLVKILDFGIAKTASAAGGKTQSGVVLGTPYYMSPEQASGTRTVDHRSDLWALAVIAYECLTGVKPFDSEGIGELLVLVMTAPIPDLVRPGLPRAVSAWWRRATSRDPDGRFQSAQELIEALAMALGASSAMTTPGSRDSLDFGRGQGMTDASYAATGLAPQAQSGAMNYASSSPRAARRSIAPVLVAFAAGVVTIGGLVAFVATRGRAAAPAAAPDAVPSAPAAAPPPAPAAVAPAASSAPTTAVEPGPPPSASPSEAPSTPPPGKRATPRPPPPVIPSAKPTKKPADMGF